MSHALLQPPVIDTRALRDAFGTYVTGVTVITTREANGRPRGMTANSFTSVSLDPALLLVCISRKASSFPAFADCSSFAVNVLHDQQIALSAQFASKIEDKFRNVLHDVAHTGSPILGDCLSWFDCAVHQRIDAGDHIVLIGQVEAFGASPLAPLGFCRGRYTEVKDPLPPEWPPSRNMRIGYIIEDGSRILLHSDGAGGWTLPTAKGRQRDRRIDLGPVGTVTLMPDTTFLYSIFDVADGDSGCIVYRGRLDATGATFSALGGDLQFFPLNELPLSQITDRDIAAVLRRYVNERGRNQYGIYMDAVDGGRIAMLEN